MTHRGFYALLSAFFAALTAIVSRVAPIDKLSVVNTLTSCIVIANRGVIYDNRSSEGKTILVCSLLDRLKFCLVMESLQVWRNQKKPLRGFVPSLKEKYFFP